jgi:hypothetical protein
MATQSHTDGGSNARGMLTLQEAYEVRDRISKSMIADGDHDSPVFVLGEYTDDEVRINVLLTKMTPTAVELLRDTRYAVEEYGDDCVLLVRYYGGL